MSRHQHNSETIQLDLRSTSQQQLHPSRSSSLPSQNEEDNQQQQHHQHRSQSATMANLRDEKSHKLDLYSIPVFLLEVLVLAGLTYFAYNLHFSAIQLENNDHKRFIVPLTSGFYCDDIAYRQQYNSETNFIKMFNRRDSELSFVTSLFAIPIALIIFCELVNSMFGALKFRQIRALCKCCKLHSITRRSFRFSGAYALGLLIVIISCDLLAVSTGRLRPYFAQECPSAYQQCILTSSSSATPTSSLPRDLSSPAPPMDQFQPASSPISGGESAATNLTPIAAALVKRDLQQAHPDNARIRQLSPAIVERQWVDFTGLNLTEVCHFSPRPIDSEESTYKFNQLALSWPSFPAAVFTYACVFLSAYLSFVAIARPFRMITCVIVMILILLAAVFNVQLVKEHFNHWEDVVSSAALSFIVTVFIIIVYLNKFKDTHYYENQKLFGRSDRRSAGVLIESDSFRGYTNGDGSFGQYGIDKSNSNAINPINNGVVQNDENGVRSLSNNDLAMRYFQIPRANYRGAPRPLSSSNQMR